MPATTFRCDYFGLVFSAMLLLRPPAGCDAQTQPSPFPPPVAASLPPDSLRPDNKSDSLTQLQLKSTARLSPPTVALYSALLPGYGQIYNRAWWKLPVIYGAMGVLAYNVVNYHSLYIDYGNRYLSDQNSLTAPTERRFRDFYREARDEFGAYLLLAYLLSIVDAYIDASLFNFDVSDDLSAPQSSLQQMPPPVSPLSIRPTRLIGLSIKF